MFGGLGFELGEENVETGDSENLWFGDERAFACLL